MAKSLVAKWVEVFDWDTAICVPPKCGTRSLYHALEAEFPMHGTLERQSISKITGAMPDKLILYRPEQVQASRRIFVSRDPVARFKSLYKQKVLGKGRVTRTLNDAVWRIESPEELFEFIQQYENQHWQPQHLYEAGIATELWTTESFTHRWNALPNTTQPMQPHNQTGSSTLALSPQLELDIRRYYAEDVALYEKAREEA